MIVDASLQAFRDYVGLKLHFNETMIWNRNCGKRLTEAALYKRKDRQFFERIAYQIRDREERIQHFVSCFLHNRNMWIGEMFDQDMRHLHRSRMMRVKALDHTVKSEVDNIIDFMVEEKYTLRDLFLTSNQSPAIFRRQSDIIGGVSRETLALLDRAFKFCSRANDNDPLWKEEAFRLAKYKYLLDVENFEGLKLQYKKLASAGQSAIKNAHTTRKNENVICIPQETERQFC